MQVTAVYLDRSSVLVIFLDSWLRGEAPIYAWEPAQSLLFGNYNDIRKRDIIENHRRNWISM